MQPFLPYLLGLSMLSVQPCSAQILKHREHSAHELKEIIQTPTFLQRKTQDLAITLDSVVYNGYRSFYLIVEDCNGDHFEIGDVDLDGIYRIWKNPGQSDELLIHEDPKNAVELDKILDQMRVYPILSKKHDGEMIRQIQCNT